jgi:hypothetical protein
MVWFKTMRLLDYLPLNATLKGFLGWILDSRKLQFFFRMILRGDVLGYSLDNLL